MLRRIKISAEELISTGVSLKLINRRKLNSIKLDAFSLNNKQVACLNLDTRASLDAI